MKKFCDFKPVSEEQINADLKEVLGPDADFIGDFALIGDLTKAQASRLKKAIEKANPLLSCKIHQELFTDGEFCDCPYHVAILIEKLEV
jgi:hypothetical protein